MFKKVLLLFLYAAVAGTNVYGASSSGQQTHYLNLNRKFFPNWPTAKVKRGDASEFSQQDYTFLKTGFPSLIDFEEFKKGCIKDKCFFLKLVVPADSQEKYLALAILQQSTRNNSLVTDISWIVVDKNQQGKGIGTSFIQYIEANIPSDVLSLMPLSESLTDFYIQKLGFQKSPKAQKSLIKFCTKPEEPEDPIYLNLDHIHFEGWPKIEIQKLGISDFSEKDYEFLEEAIPDIATELEEAIPDIATEFELFKQNHKDCFFFKSTILEPDEKEKHVAVAICKTSLIEDDILLTEVLWIAVDLALQGKGIGKAFMENIETNTQCDAVSLTPARDAIPFYIKLGFKKILSEEKCKKYHNPYVKFSGKNPQHA